jgi:hypothetical protein
MLTVVPATCCESSYPNAGVPALVSKLFAYDEKRLEEMV